MVKRTGRRGRAAARAAAEVAAAERQRRRTQCMQLRLKGHTFDAIATELEYTSKQAAHADYRAALADVRSDYEQTADDARRVELARLDHLQTIAWGTAAGADPALSLKGIETILKISQARARLLGLDQPVRHEISWDAIDAKIAALESFLAEHDTDGDERP